MEIAMAAGSNRRRLLAMESHDDLLGRVEPTASRPLSANSPPRHCPMRGAYSRGRRCSTTVVP